MFADRATAGPPSRRDQNSMAHMVDGQLPSTETSEDAAGHAPAVALRATSIAAERVRQFIKSHDRLMTGAESFWRLVDSVPAPLGTVLQSLKRRMLRETGWAELRLVIESLESEGVSYWVAGGWGVDALLGRCTRRHKDIDIVIDDFEHNEPKVRQAFFSFGFDHITTDQGGVWMPWRSNFEDRAGHRIEVLAIDWDHLRKVFALDPGREPKSTWEIEDLVGEVLTLGEIEGRPVPCLALAAQLLFHTGFPLEASGRVDVSRLRSEFGMAV